MNKAEPNVHSGLEGLGDRMVRTVERNKEQLLKRVSALQLAAEELGMNEVATRLHETRQNLEDDRFKIIVVGRFKNGKSTLLNALLGKSIHPVEGLRSDQGPLKSDRLPCTATLTRVVYSSKPYVKKWNVDGSAEDWSFSRYLSESSVKASEEETVRFFDSVREFEVGFPAELCSSGIELLDSPGTSDAPKRTEYTIQAIRRSDAAIVVFADRALAGQDEREFVARDVIGEGATRIFTVVNLWDTIDEAFKYFVWERLVVNKSKEDVHYQESDFEKNDVFFVDAKAALRSKLTDDRAGAVDSGLLALEARLGEFLSKERHLTHMERWIQKALLYGGSIPGQVRQRLGALQKDQDELRERLQKAQSDLGATRGRRDKLENIFQAYRRKIKSAGRISFQDAITRISKELPEDLEKVKLKSLEGWVECAGAIFRPKPATEETIKLVEEIASKQIKRWAQDPADSCGLRNAVLPHLEAMIAEVRSEVVEIDAAIQQINYDTTDWLPAADDKVRIVSVTERVVCGVAGLFIGGAFDSILSAGRGGGWPSLAGNLIGQIGGLAVLTGLSFFGIALGPISILVMAVAGTMGSLTGSAAVIEKRIKKSVFNRVREKLANLPEEKFREVEEGVDKEMARIEEGVLNEVDSAIREEEQRLLSLIQDNERSQQEKAALAVQLDEIERGVNDELKALRDSIIVAQQIVG